ncbi:unnamed protein product, partial [Adineta ricciae]
TRLNHIAITVYDVGRSVSFYVDVLGFQQIRRPSFDRHGAWLTMGNVELHLIKGIPAIPSVDNLQVNHLAFETSNLNEVLIQLHRLKIEIRQNLSVTNAHRLISEGKPVVTQYFFKDPDGYSIELCNCDVLEEFSFDFKLEKKSMNGEERFDHKRTFFVIYCVSRWKRKVQRSLKEEMKKRICYSNEVDKTKLRNLIERRTIYGDFIQNFDEKDLCDALIQSNNIVPLALRCLLAKRGEQICLRPSSFLHQGKLFHPKPFTINRLSSSTLNDLFPPNIIEC